MIQQIKSKLLTFIYDNVQSLKRNWEVLKQGVICFVQFEGVLDDSNYIHVLHHWMTYRRADSGHKAVFIDSVLYQPKKSRT